MPYRFQEYFAGAGLARLGLGKEWNVVMANDISEDKAAIYKTNFESEHFILEDINKLDITAIPNAEMAWASFPCQDLSLAGYRQGMEARRSGTFWAFWRIMKEKRELGEMPPLIVIENVEGILSDKNINGLCHALAALGLQFGFTVMDAAHFLPQSRKRVFIVAMDAQIDVSKYTYSESPLNDMWLTNGVKKAFENLDPQLKKLWRWWKIEHFIGNRTTLETIIESNPIDVNIHSSSDTQKLITMMSETNLKKLENVKKLNKVKVGTLYKRMRNKVQRAEVRFDGIAGCLRTPKGGSSVQTIVIVKHGNVSTRLISKREAARLMGVPDSFKLPESRSKALYAMGDAVAVPVVNWLSKKLLIPLVLEYNIQKDNVNNKLQSDDYLYFNTVAMNSLKRWEKGV